MTKYVIINADDFGLSASVNRGILESFRNETVSSTTLMTNMAGFDDAIRIAKETPKLGVGLHFNLTYGGPLSKPAKVPSLVNAAGVYAGVNRSGWQAADIRTELQAQWNKFVDTGRTPTHIDSHHHIHQTDPVYSVVAEFALAQKLPIRNVGVVPHPDRATPPTTDRLVMAEYFIGDGKKRLLQYIAELEDGIVEFCCHPGYVDDDVRAVSPWTDVREVELAVFTDAEVAAAIRRAGVVRTNFGRIRV